VRLWNFADGFQIASACGIAISTFTVTLQDRVRDVDVFARASPEHKLRLVKAIQANKQIVAE
jgi:magnesium-transporting ATPase (P-type)